MFNREMNTKASSTEAQKMRSHMTLLAKKDDLDSAMSNVTKDVFQLTSKVNEEYVSVAQME